MSQDHGNNPDGSTKQLPAKCKFREIKVHASDEWMADGTKKYRQVYDRYEASHIRVELSFYNKLFDEEDWDANIVLKCFFVNGSSSRELCKLEQKRKILKDENVVYIRDSWGNPTPGSYWTKGNYSWEGYIDDVKIGEYKFYIEDVGISKPGENLFFDIQHIKLFEGDAQAQSVTEKKYLSKFSFKDTRYVWGEFCFTNKTNTDYYAEVIFNFFNDAGQPKGRSARLQYIQPNTAGQAYFIYPAWGSDTPGTWKDDVYTMEVVFMDNLIATVPFRVGEIVEEGTVSVITDVEKMLTPTVAQGTSASTNKSLDDILFESLAELNSLTGLNGIKTEVNEMVKLVRFYQESGKDIVNKFSLHTVFTGNPGTGKTTVARILAKIYKGLGVLEKGHLIEVDRQALVAGYVGQTAIKTGDKINEAMGGVLFIDEAYALANENGAQHDFGGESIQVILKRMEDLRGKFGVIVAGYTENMQEFISSNPGLRSRFDKYFFFEDYSPEDMFTIALAIFSKEGVTPEPAACEHLKKYFAFLYSLRDKHFGNARTVRQVVGEVVKNQHLRLAGMKKEDRTKEIMDAIIFDDVKEFEIKETSGPSRPLGFQVRKK
ncbi:MAG TPA: AAA family ATPase [Cyclobacteriaceae bacterium]|nr:AAA family ATPase [Cyclobacteriaceae bacterium]